MIFVLWDEQNGNAIKVDFVGQDMLDYRRFTE